MGLAFTQPLDIMNRALQHCELPRIASINEMSPNAQELVFAYDKIRRRELRRNVWRFATKRAALRPMATTTVLLKPPLYDPTITYLGAAIVADSAANYWINLISANTGNVPGTPGSGWEAYFGPLTITPWGQPSPPDLNSGNPYAWPAPDVPYGTVTGQVGYYTGELVYLPDNKGGITIFQSLTTTGTQTDGPNQIDLWYPSVTYAKGQIAFIYTDPGGILILGAPPGLGIGGLTTTAFQSTIDFNTGNQPDLCEPLGAQPWTALYSYTVGDIVVGTDTQLYQSVAKNNLNNNPIHDQIFAFWKPIGMYSGTWIQTLSPFPRAISNQWQYVPGSTAQMVIPYPLSAGPLENSHTRNAFRLPAGYLREAPADPKRGGIGYLGAPNLPTTDSTDWVYEGDFLISDDALPILYRFVADVTDVTKMDDMFCEGIAAELAAAVQPILQPGRADLKVQIRAEYDKSIEEARTVNGIETGDVQPPLDEYLTCRL